MTEEAAQSKEKKTIITRTTTKLCKAEENEEGCMANGKDILALA